MDLGPLLRCMGLVHLEGRECGGSVGVKVESLARRECMSPVTRGDIVACADIESSGRSKKSVDSPNVSTLFVPTENERLVIGVCQPATTADFTLNVRSQ